MAKEIICAGFGGQGVLTAGMLLINAGMEQDKNVLFYPSYGSEMRGGTANCTVKISDKLIASPISKQPDILFTKITCTMQIPKADATRTVPEKTASFSLDPTEKQKETMMPC